jgi:hypothetical protein
MHSESISELAAALCAAQSEMTPAKFNATNPFLKNKYADLGSVIEASRPVLAKNGLAVSQLVGGEGTCISLDTILMHKSGQWLSSSVSLQVGDEKGKSSAQVAGSIISYLRRYSLASILGMYADEDGDGNQPPARQERKPAPGMRPKNAREIMADMVTEEAIEYPPELAVVTTHDGKFYVELPDDKLNFMAAEIRKALDKKDLSEDQKSNYSMKADVIKQIQAIRNS